MIRVFFILLIVKERNTDKIAGWIAWGSDVGQAPTCDRLACVRRKSYCKAPLLRQVVSISHVYAFYLLWNFLRTIIFQSEPICRDGPQMLSEWNMRPTLKYH